MHGVTLTVRGSIGKIEQILGELRQRQNMNPRKMGKSRFESVLTFPICLSCIIYCNVKYIQDTFMAKLQKIAYN